MDCAWICLACAFGPVGDGDDIFSARIEKASNSGCEDAVGRVKIGCALKEGMKDGQRGVIIGSKRLSEALEGWG